MKGEILDIETVQELEMGRKEIERLKRKVNLQDLEKEKIIEKEVEHNERF